MKLSQIRLAASQRADMENSRFIGTAEWNMYINLAYSELYDLLISRFDDYYMTDPAPTFTVSQGQSSITLPDDFYKLRGLDMALSGESSWVSVPKFVFNERNAGNRNTNRLRYGTRNISYRVVGRLIRLIPESDCSGYFRLWYVPRFIPLVNDDDEMGDVLDFEEFVILSVAIMALTKEESDASLLLALKEGQMQRILAMSADRDAGAPERISDSSGEYALDGGFFPI